MDALIVTREHWWYKCSVLGCHRPRAQGKAVECSGHSAIPYPRHTSCLEMSLPDAVQLGQATCQGWLAVTREAPQHCLMEGKRKSAPKIESKWQMVGTEGSIPERPVVRDVSERRSQGATPLRVINSLSGDKLVASSSGSLINPVCIISN